MIRESVVLPEKERCHSHEIETTSASDMILGLVLASLIKVTIMLDIFGFWYRA